MTDDLFSSKSPLKTRFAIVFICTGNICRSPTAAGVFRKHVADAGLEDRIAVESAGTHGYHVGEPADSRALRAAHQRGYDLSRHRARKLDRLDFHRFDLVIAMDEGHRADLARLARPSDAHKIRMMMEFAKRHAGVTAVPDPYYGALDGFERVLDMLEDASVGLLAAVRDQLQP
jgi:protein-tyrosine phosphatase